MEKGKKIFITLKTKFVLDHLTFDWMCPLCEVIHSPMIPQCPATHKLSSEEKKSEIKTWIYKAKKNRNIGSIRPEAAGNGPGITP